MGIAFILVNCDMGSEIQTIVKLKELCDEVQGTYGIFDFICKLNYDNTESFEKTCEYQRKGSWGATSDSASHNKVRQVWRGEVNIKRVVISMDIFSKWGGKPLGALNRGLHQI